MKLHEFVAIEMKKQKINMSRLGELSNVDSGNISRFLAGKYKRGESLLVMTKIFKALNLDMNKIYELEI